jgi:peptidoglycan/xylan/chitin deacetylase (PgdA/CDA1 family)
MLQKSKPALFSFLMIILFPMCTKEYGHLAGIVFTVDDGYVNSWYPYLNYLDSVHFKLTFYITGYHEFTDSEKEILKEFKVHGHEIAYHTTNHINVNDFLENKSAADYIREEIIPDLELMNKDSLEVKNFAYPFGYGDKIVDQLLLDYFKSIRKIRVTTYFRLYELDEIYYDFPTNDRILYGADIDRSSEVTGSDIEKSLKRAKEENKVLFIYCHKTGNTGDDYEISEARFRQIIEYCNNHEITSLTVNELLAF